MELTHVDLFSGIGGFALAARANGIRTIQFCECDERCREFLSRAWPGVPCWPDIRTFTVGYSKSNNRMLLCRPREDGEKAHGEVFNEHRGSACAGAWILTAGVPCQPASRAGKQRGSEDDRWLWPEAVRALAAVRPTWALFENPPGIGDVGLAGILSAVEAEGYEVRVLSIPACAVGAPHRRERFWIVAHASDQGREGANPEPGTDGLHSEYPESELADAKERGQREHWGASGQPGHADECGEGQWSDFVWLPCADGKVRRAPGDAFGLVDGLHRSVLGALGNSIVPQVAERIIAAMVEADNL